MTHEDQLRNPKYRNWVKGSLSLKYLRDGIEEIADTLVKSKHREVLLQLGVTSDQTCKQCKIPNLIPVHTSVKDPDNGNEVCPLGQQKCNCFNKNKHKQKCQKHICDKIHDRILTEHASTPASPNWKNTDISKWTTHPWEIAKCFINAPGYAKFQEAKEIDVSGLLHIFINNISFQDHLFQKDLPKEALETRNSILHAPLMELDTQTLEKCIQTTTALLTDKKLKEVVTDNTSGARQALVNIQQLEKQDLQISAKMEKEACKSALREEHRDEHLKQQSLITPLKKRITELEQEEGKKQLEERIKALRTDLMIHYREKESRLPLIDRSAKPLFDLYVRPPMEGYYLKQIDDDGNTSNKQCEICVSSYKDLFLKEDKTMFDNIYVKAEAGMGKTSFTKHLALTWCDTHELKEQDAQKYRKDDLETLKRFDFLFLIRLREHQGCNMDDIILEMLSSYMSRSCLYSKELLQNILHEQKCLVVLDGLDEWMHPDSCEREPKVPHNNHSNNCTVLFTSRPWKISSLGLSEMTDIYIKISELDFETSEKLESNAFKLLNKANMSDIQPKYVEDFRKAVSSLELGTVQNIPYIKLQLLGLWFMNRPIGKSRCDLFSNIVELTIERGSKKLHKEELNELGKRPCDVDLFRRNKTEMCESYSQLLNKLGQLAFFALFNPTKESALVIDKKEVLKYLEEDEIQLLLEFGLLSQNKNTGKVTKISLTFQHKSMQEFFAGLYISSQWNDQNKKTVFKRCETLPEVLEMTDVFIFVSGIMKAEDYISFANELRRVIDHDMSAIEFRTELYPRTEYVDMATFYETMLIACFKESERNGNDQCLLGIADLILPFVVDQEEDKQSRYDEFILERLAQNNKNNLKVMHVSYNKRMLSFISNLGLCFLETIRIYGNIISIKTILTDSVQSVKCLSLEDVEISEKDLNDICACLSGMTRLERLKIRSKGTNITIQLDKLDKLKVLHISGVCLNDLRVNKTCLEECRIDGRNKAFISGDASERFLKDIRETTILKELYVSCVNISPMHLTNTISTLFRLRTLELTRIDLLENALEFENRGEKMNMLESITLCQTTLTYSSWKKLIVDIGELPVFQHLKMIRINMTAEWWKLVLVDCVSKMPRDIKVEIIRANGPSELEWERIYREFELLPTLQVKIKTKGDPHYQSFTLLT